MFADKEALEKAIANNKEINDYNLRVLELAMAAGNRICNEVDAEEPKVSPAHVIATLYALMVELSGLDIDTERENLKIGRNLAKLSREMEEAR